MVFCRHGPSGPDRGCLSGEEHGPWGLTTLASASARQDRPDDVRSACAGLSPARELLVGLFGMAERGFDRETIKLLLAGPCPMDMALFEFWLKKF